jgi:cytochrome oxidase Cu insertion factor (SCO1/SenC/PrrC family)
VKVRQSSRLVRAIAGTVIGLFLATPAAAEGLYRLPFIFTDDGGRTVGLDQWSGHPAVVAMEYSNCRFMCSITLLRLKEVQAAADRRGIPLQFLVISLDPKNDTPAAWTQYRINRDLQRDNWHFLTASEADTKRLARYLGIRYWYYDEHLLHDFRLLRVGPDGRILKIMTTYDADPGRFAD